jgi:biotin carboxylase
MARFLCFIHGIGDIAEFRSDFPEHDFFFVSQNSIPGASAVVRPETVEQTIEELKRLHALQPFAGIVFGSGLELYVKSADQFASALGLRRFVSDAEAVRDKYAMRRAFAGKVACPESRVVKAGEDAATLPDLKFPCVLKPRHGFGSIAFLRRETEGNSRPHKKACKPQKGGPDMRARFASSPRAGAAPDGFKGLG